MVDLGAAPGGRWNAGEQCHAGVTPGWNDGVTAFGVLGGVTGDFPGKKTLESAGTGLVISARVSRRRIVAAEKTSKGIG